MEKLTPYQNLRNILTEGEQIILTNNGQKNLDQLLEIQKEKPKNKNKILKFFIKIDNWIFSKKSRKWNTTFYKR